MRTHANLAGYGDFLAPGDPDFATPLLGRKRNGRPLDDSDPTQELAVIRGVARILTSTPDIDEMFEKVAAEMRRLLDFDRMLITTVDRGTATSVIRYLCGSNLSDLHVGDATPMQRSQTQHIMKTGRSLIRPDIAGDPRFREDQTLLKLGIRSSILVPLIAQGNIIGVLALSSHRVGNYGTREQVILEALANQIAPAIENAHLYQQTRVLSHAVEQSPSSVVITDIKGIIQYVNPKFTQITGYALEEVLGKNVAILKSEETPSQEYRQLWETITCGKEWRGEFYNKKKSGELYLSSQAISSIRDSDGSITHFIAVEEDVTERKMLQQQLLQSQKMDSIGRLAGGIAHDFNNLLTAILGYAQLGLIELPPGYLVGGYLQEIQKAAERATSLTRQLLAFSRRQVIEPRVVNLNELILDMDKMLRRLIGEDIELVTLPSAEVGLAKVDPNQIERVLMNLAVNARDAMPTGGKLTIETENVTLDADYARQQIDVCPGDYVVVAVSDTGMGMTEEVKGHLFEPFFTTKEMDKGTGLGLATCYGIVKQSGGHIAVNSQLGQGTTFKIYLPRVAETADNKAGDNRAARPPRGTETVLLVEDEPLVRAMAARVLRGQGYTVLEVANGVEALHVSQEQAGEKIHLLLTDVVMPQMSGTELSDQLRAARPDIKVIFTSGYTNQAIHRGILDSGLEFIQKPFMPDVLALKVRQVLDQQETLDSSPSRS